MSRCFVNPWRAAVALAIAQAVAVASPARAQPLSVAVSGTWARASAGPIGTGAIYATMTASQPDRLTGGSTPVAATAELHRDMTSGGMTQMRPVAGGLPLAPGTPVHLQPGGYHLMLTGLTHPLKQGEHFPVTFMFQHAAPVTADVAVAGPGAIEPPPSPAKP